MGPTMIMTAKFRNASMTAKFRNGSYTEIGSGSPAMIMNAKFRNGSYYDNDREISQCVLHRHYEMFQIGLIHGLRYNYYLL